MVTFFSYFILSTLFIFLLYSLSYFFFIYLLTTLNIFFLKLHAEKFYLNYEDTEGVYVLQYRKMITPYMPYLSHEHHAHLFKNINN